MASLTPAIGRACFGAGPLTAAIVRASLRAGTLTPAIGRASLRASTLTPAIGLASLGAGPLTPAQGAALSRACGHSCRITGTAALCLHGAELAAIYRTVKSPW